MSNIQSDRSQPDEPIRHHHDSDSVSITFIGTIGLRKQIAGIAALKNKSASAFMRDVLQNAVDGVPSESVTDCNALKKELDEVKKDFVIVQAERDATEEFLEQAKAEIDALKEQLKSAEAERDAADTVLLAAQPVQSAASEPVSVTVKEPGNTMTIKIATDFSNTPGGRYIHEGDFSGEQFRIDILLPKYDEAVLKKEKLCIDLDGCYGFATSFLEEAFGGLARIKNTTKIEDNLEFICNDEPSLENRIRKFIREALKIKAVDVPLNINVRLRVTVETV